MNYTLRCFLVSCALLVGSRAARAQAGAKRDSAEYYFQLGATCYEDHSGRIPQAQLAVRRRRAMNNYTQSIAFDSSYYWSYRNRGYCHETFGEYALALADYTHAVQAGERSHEADAAHVRFDCLRLCLHLQKWAEAEAHCSALLRNTHLCRSQTDAFCRSLWQHRTEARMQLNRYAEARQDYVIYQQLTAAELAAEHQKLIRTGVAKKAPHLSKRERASRADWGGNPPKQPTAVKQLTQERRAVASKLRKLEKVLKQ